MGNPDDTKPKKGADTFSLHSNPGGGSSSAAYSYSDNPPSDQHDDVLDPPSPSDDLPPTYTAAATASQLADAAPLLSQPIPELDLLETRVAHTDRESGYVAYVDGPLTTDPTHLESFIRSNASRPPRPHMRILGTHTETRQSSGAGRKGRNSKTETSTVTDFDVQCDLTPYLFQDVASGKSWSYIRTVGERESCRRGTIFRTKGDIKKQLDIEASGGRAAAGDAFSPSHTLREWCHRFVASHAGLKCFSLQRRMIGFDETRVKEQLHRLVRGPGVNYRGTLTVELVTKDALVEVYNESAVNRWRLTAWVWWLFVLTFMWLLSWPYLFFMTRRWEVVVVEWPFSRTWDDQRDGGGKQYASIDEDTWFGLWGPAVQKAVLAKRQSVLGPDDLRDAQEAAPEFNTGNRVVDGGLGLFRASMNAVTEVNRQLGWGGDR